MKFPIMQGESLSADESLVNLVGEYQTLLNRLDTQINQNQEKQNIHTPAALKEAAINLLVKRDQIEASLKQLAPDGKTFNELYDADEKLYRLLQNLIQNYHLEPMRWRYVQPDKDNLAWWWYADKPILRVDDRFLPRRDSDSAQALGVVFLLSALVLIIINTIQLLGDEQILLATLNIVAQVALSGILALGFVNRILGSVISGIGAGFNFIQQRFRVDNENRSLHGIRTARGAHFNFLLFATTVLLLAALLPGIIRTGANDLFHRALNAVEGGVNLEAANFYLTLVNRLDPSTPGAAANLAQLGLQYQNNGQMEEAVMIYQRALAFDGRIVLALDQLAEYYVDIDNNQQAIALTDRAVHLLRQHLNSDTRLQMNDDDAHKWLFKALVTRARAHLNAGQYNVAFLDLGEAIKLTEEDDADNPLFLTKAVLDRLNYLDTAPPESADRIGEAYYLRGYVWLELLAATGCSDIMVRNALADFNLVSALVDPEPVFSIERVWRTEAADIQRQLRNLDCNTLEKDNFTWPVKKSY